VKLRLDLEAITEAKEIVLKPSVRGPVSLSLPVQRAKVRAGDTTLLWEWETKSVPAGDYTIELLVNDESGNILARVQEQVRVGIPAGKLVSFTAEPNPFRIGEDINLTLEFQNTGSCPFSGEGIFRLFREDSLIAEFSSPYENLAPGSSVTLTRTWHTGQAEKGVNYYVTAFVRYGGNATPVQQVRLSTNRPPSAKFSFRPQQPAPGQSVAFDASTSTDADGEIVDYRWDFGDGATAQGIKTAHRYQLPGVYGVKLTVTDNEGGIMTDTQPVEIKE
jgi:PKD repeat protein